MVVQHNKITETAINRLNDGTILILATVPFLLNDVGNIFVSNYVAWLLIDYGSRLISLAFLGLLLVKGRLEPKQLGLNPIGVGPLLLWTVVATAVGLCLDQFAPRFFAAILPDTRLGSAPPITNESVRQIDLYLGLALVAISEELVFRGLYFSVFSQHFKHLGPTVILSAVFFGAIHWSLGLSAILSTLLIGILFMMCVCKTKSIVPTTIAHFIVNYIAFSGT